MPPPPLGAVHVVGVNVVVCAREKHKANRKSALRNAGARARAKWAAAREKLQINRSN